MPDLSADRQPVLLAPTDATGWFGGTPLLALDPVRSVEGVSLAEAALSLEEAFESGEFRLAAALIRYDGTSDVRVYGSAYQGRGDTWVPFGHGALPLPEPLRPSAGGGSLLLDARGDLDGREWCERVRSVQDSIREGDVYVLNLTHRVTGTPCLAAVDAFARLHARSAGPMSALWLGGGTEVASVSPERFVSVTALEEGRVAEVWPIKGTRPRHADAAQDAAAVDELLACEKERAEHVMVVDMERNDLGRVSVPGSVRVEPLLEVFQTPYCHQMVSRVRSLLRTDVGIHDLLAATFPCGSVTGAPKIAAMRIIESLEVSLRGAYTGALAVAIPGRLDSAVLIRTLEYASDGSAAWGTGGGITIDSDPQEEWAEARLKVSPVLGEAGS
ncbi:MAG: anthranilate synthase component I family protein [Coriobacteriia bacterium]|nr:anthranilate synthase component I family protein [Coriobacteriia bacterium]